MVYVNYVILLLVALFISSWTFTHISAWVGIGFFVVCLYLVVYKVVNYLKGGKNEIK